MRAITAFTLAALLTGCGSDPRAPEAVGTMPAMELETGETKAVALAKYFSDPDGDELTYSAASATTGVATVTVAMDSVKVTGVATGSAEITVKAADGGGLTAEQKFTATVIVTEARVGRVANVAATISTAPAVWRAMEDSGDSRLEFEIDCPEGGKARWSGIVVAGEFDIALGGNTEFDGCADRVGEVVVTLDGNTLDDEVYTETTVHFPFDDDDNKSEIMVTGTVDGVVDWSDSDGREGTCELELELDVLFEITHEPWDIEQSGGMSGTICGIEIELDDLDWEHWLWQHQ